MRYRRLGRTGITVSELGFGCGNVGGFMTRGEPAEQRRVIARALEAGITYFDTAPSYGNGRSEESLGRALTDLGAWDSVVVGTKVNISGDDLINVASAVRASVSASLKRLGRERVDLLQLHSRIGGRGDRALGAAEVAGPVATAMREMVSEGLAGHVGITGLGETDAVLDVVRSGAFDTVQAYFNALNPSAAYAGAAGGAQDLGGLIDEAAGLDMGVIAIRIMAAGAVSASRERAALASRAGGGAMVVGGDFDADIERATALEAIAGERGLESPQELAVRFAISKPGVSTALVGFSNMSQLEDALRWAERGPLPGDVIGHVLRAARAGGR